MVLRHWVERHRPDNGSKPSAPFKSLRGHNDCVHSVAFHPSAEHHSKLLASGSGDSTVRLWDWKAGMELKTLRGYPGPAPQ